jgi:ABC-2 type transport system ATP-binding protein
VQKSSKAAVRIFSFFRSVRRYDLSQDGRKYRFSADSHAMTGIMRFLLPLGIKALTVEPPSLEELFMRHYGDDLRDKEEA